MKRLFVIGLTALFCTCVSNPTPVPNATSVSTVSQTTITGNTDELDVAIQEVSNYLINNIPKGNKVVFLNIRSDYPDLSDYILSSISENAVNSRVFSVVDRREIDLLRSELDFQYSGEVSDDSAQAIGRMLGAQTIVSGSASKFGSLYRIQIKAIEVQSAAVQGQWNKNVPNGMTIAALTERYAPTSVSTTASGTRPAQSSGGTAQTIQNVPAQAVPTPPSEPVATPPPPTTYKVGDRGPGGGKIFYVSETGFSVNGVICHYLEAALADIGTFIWSNLPTVVMGTKTGIGTGAENTAALLALDSNAGAARACNMYRNGGKNDWFLPSKDELNEMYWNKAVIGGFSGEWYWSSTEGSAHRAWGQKFDDGKQDQYFQWGYGRDSRALVRPIRAF